MTESNFNRIWNAQNPNQGDYKKVLCVCSAGLLRSPTAALVLSNDPFNFNTRAAGLDKGHALICVDEVLLAWADEIVCMTKEQEERLQGMTKKNIICLEIEDSYTYRNKELQSLIAKKYKRIP
jgi:predicted protein tyrosine phosphatase